ncbi:MULTISPECIES: M23 family metallopeptidase [unclassified Paenibacillus]|uniref:M23 family metallopeptidase n=1 Tax=unclassified Paenibacillus TaxID=185978 RepID=UPI0009A765AD|nr:MULTISPECIES: M23 family metallopeptidase [unclassified Paenibacillus]SLK04283.1 Peptidase family M23 [Paenibacillus sp. RU5A]SOC69633.1 Peptidase family M23 [Paenibacillus sp. RU26A]SOC72047.1 Peptidase family M23 [Paenibacillus sp. RU5M]
MNSLKEGSKIRANHLNGGGSLPKSGYAAHEKLQSKKSWKLLAIALGACVMLSACGNSNSITSEQAEQQSKEQTTNANEASESTHQEENSGTEVSAIITPDNFIDTLMNGSKDAIYSQMSPELKEALTLEQFTTSADQFLEGVTSFDLVVDAKVNHLTEFAWKDQTGTKGIQAYFTEANQIEGLLIQPLELHEDTDQTFTKTEFQFPMKGEWYVFWGGNDVMSNYHYEHETQRYALDIIRTKEAFSYNGDAKVNENYYAFGEPLYAAADGTVVEIKNDIPDNTPGVMNPEEPAGNNVVIDHGNGEYSITGHIKEGSVSVKKGDKVKQGDLIGELGNSGNSSEAHLHFQVSDGQDLFTSRSVNIRWADQSQQLTRGNTIQGLPE